MRFGSVGGVEVPSTKPLLIFTVIVLPLLRVVVVSCFQVVVSQRPKPKTDRSSEGVASGSS